MIPIIGKSQGHNNQRIKTILIKDSIIKIDSFSIIPGSFLVYNKDSIIINNNTKTQTIYPSYPLLHNL